MCVCVNVLASMCAIKECRPFGDLLIVDIFFFLLSLDIIFLFGLFVATVCAIFMRLFVVFCRHTHTYSTWRLCATREHTKKKVHASTRSSSKFALAAVRFSSIRSLVFLLLLRRFDIVVSVLLLANFAVRFGLHEIVNYIVASCAWRAIFIVSMPLRSCANAVKARMSSFFAESVVECVCTIATNAWRWI